MKTRIFYTIMMLLTAFAASAQHQAMFTQYMFNTTAINPAAVGSHETLSLTVLGRQQWVGIDGAPSTQTLALHAPLNQEKLAAGLLVMRDKIGVTSQTVFFGQGAYRILFPKGTLSMGLQFGFSAYASDFLDLNPNNPDNDPSIAADVSNSFLPNIGGGLYYYTERFYAGISSPLLLNNFVDENNLGDISIRNNRPDLERHYFGMLGYVFDLSPSVKFRPSTLIKLVDGAPLEFDLNANFLFDEVLWLGVSYRSFDSVSGLIELQASNQLKLGYAYDYTLSDLSQFTSGTHEIMINYRFAFKKERIITPRYF